MDHVWFSFSWTFGVLCFIAAGVTGSGFWFIGGWMIVLLNAIRHQVWELTELSRQAKVKPSDGKRVE